MLCLMTQAVTYAGWLSERMRERGLTQRSLGKALNPSNPEVGRRAVRRYLGGMVPLERTQKLIAETLGVTETGPAPQDDEELDLISMLKRQLVDIQLTISRIESQATDAEHGRHINELLRDKDVA